MNYKSQTVSAIIITYNNAASLEDTLMSLRWADELVVLDRGSTDGTLAIARRFTEKVHFHPSGQPAALRKDALALGASDWLLLVEPDEQVPDMLKHEIEGVLLNTNASINGYTITRRLSFQKQWVRYGKAERAVRLVRKGKWRIADDWEGILAVEGETARLDRPLEYAPYATVDELFADVNRLSTIEAYRHLEANGVSISDQNMLNIVWKAKWTALSGYVFGGGFQDGFAGVVMAMAQLMGTFMKFAKIRMLTKKPEKAKA